MPYQDCPTVPAEITIAKDRQHRIGLRIRKGIGKTEIALTGGAANADNEPDRIVIVGLCLRIMGIIDGEAQRPLLPGGRDIGWAPTLSMLKPPRNPAMHPAAVKELAHEAGLTGAPPLVAP